MWNWVLCDSEFQSFSALAADSPWDSRSIWSTMAFYMFSLHIPLSFGGISVIAQILKEPNLDTQTEVSNYFFTSMLNSDYKMHCLTNFELWMNGRLSKGMMKLVINGNLIFVVFYFYFFKLVELLVPYITFLKHGSLFD